MAEKICPIMSYRNYNTESKCLECKCGYWNEQNQECCMLTLSKNFQNLNSALDDMTSNGWTGKMLRISVD